MGGKRTRGVDISAAGNSALEKEGSATIACDYYDSSDEEDLRNTIGNIPVQWYGGHSHVGYDWSGKKILQSKAAGQTRPDAIDTFLEKVEDPDYWRRVFDQQSGGDVALTNAQVDALKAIAQSRYPKIGYNPYEPFVDIFSSSKEVHPISNQPEHKRSFLPSADERRIVSRMVHAIKMGWKKLEGEGDEGSEDEQAEEGEDTEMEVNYDLWEETEDNQDPMSKSERARRNMHLPAPKCALPEHAESYNPPSEYLFDEGEKRQWESSDKEMRRPNFMPQKYPALRKVPFYQDFYAERIERCLDLYLAPRQRKQRLNVEASDLLPKLPDPRELQPFPTTLAFYLRGHKGQVRTLSIEPQRGELLVSGGEDATARVWHIPNGFCMRSYQLISPITSLEYCPNAERALLLIGCESNVLSVMNVNCGDRLVVSNTNELLSSLELTGGDSNDVSWAKKLRKGSKEAAVELTLPNGVRKVVWHRRGDYFATVGFEASTTAILIHQLSTGATQKPFNKNKGKVTCVEFHPSQPWFFIATQQYIRLYDLAECTFKRKLYTGSRWISCMQVHRGGSNLFVGGLDRVFTWLDLELSAKPWKSLKHHSAAIRALCYHKRYPLLATASDDATALVYHAKVSEDLLQENLLVPVKRLLTDHEVQRSVPEKGIQKNDETSEKAPSAEKSPATKLAILAVTFHPTQPWLFTAGADGRIGVFSY